jgi:chlorobactene glucosyltransferase
VRSLLAQNYPHLEIVVVDDNSTDTTPAIVMCLAATDARLRVVRLEQLPPGWTGKSHAVYVGVQHTRGAWLLFVDADVTLQPSAVSAAYLTARRHNVAILSLWARQELVSFWERVAQPVIVGMGHASDPWQRVSSARHPHTAFANGQFILVERRAYERIGGHAAIRDEVLEDQALSWHFKRAGERLLMLDGTRVLSTRMYTSLRGLWEGWSKNNFLILQRRLWLTVGAILAVYGVAVSPFVLATIILLASVEWGSQELALLMINIVAAIVVLGTRWRMRSYFDTPWPYYFCHPLGGLIFIGIMLNSAYRHLSGRGVTWKGRRYVDATVFGR